MIFKDLFANTYKNKQLLIDEGKGAFLYFENKEYLDFISGVSFNPLGYDNKCIIDSSINQIQKVIHPSNYYYTYPQKDMAEKLIELSGLNKVFFANSGSEANEAALAFLMKYQKNIAKDRNEIIVFNGAFLGRTYGCRVMNNGGNIDNIKIIKIDINNFDQFAEVLSEKTLAVHLELVQAHGGIRMMEPKFVKAICEICAKKEIKVFIDEVQTGLGRCGSSFLFKTYDIKPDIVTLGKSLGGGFPLSAVLVNNSIANIISPGDYGSTMGGNSVACSAGMNILNYIDNRDNLIHINDISELLINKLNQIKEKYKFITDVRGVGLLIGIEVNSSNLATKIRSNCLVNGLLIDIVNNCVIRIAPQFFITCHHVDTFIKKLEKSFEVEL